MKKLAVVLMGIFLVPAGAVFADYYDYDYGGYSYGGGYYDQGPVVYGDSSVVYGWGGTQEYYSYPQYSYDYYGYAPQYSYYQQPQYNYYYASAQPQSYWCNGYYSNTPCTYQHQPYSMYNYQYYPVQYTMPYAYQQGPVMTNNINISSGFYW